VDGDRPVRRHAASRVSRAAPRLGRSDAARRACSPRKTAGAIPFGGSTDRPAVSTDSRLEEIRTVLTI
jgi:hypothetical protein